MEENYELVPIKGFDGYYITREGKVFCDLGKGCRDRSKRVEPYEVNPRPNKTGYMRVCMREDGTHKRKDKYVHRLVAEHFIPQVEGKPHVNHIDSDRSNNHVDNLEWCNQKENNQHAMDHGYMTRDSHGRFTHK